MKVDKSETGLTATGYTPGELAGLKRQLEANNMEYTVQNRQLTVTYDAMYANIRSNTTPVPVEEQ